MTGQIQTKKKKTTYENMLGLPTFLAYVMLSDD
jgi:hypothetical protein